MPKGTAVHRCYEQLKKKFSTSSSVRICQSKTGQSLKTGKKSKK